MLHVINHRLGGSDADEGGLAYLLAVVLVSLVEDVEVGDRASSPRVTAPPCSYIT